MVRWNARGGCRFSTCLQILQTLDHVDPQLGVLVHQVEDLKMLDNPREFETIYFGVTAD